MIDLKINSQWDSSVCVQEMKRQFPGGKLENLKTQKLMNKVPFRRVEIPSKHGVLRNIYSFILDPATIWLNSLGKKGQTCDFFILEGVVKKVWDFEATYALYFYRSKMILDCPNCLDGLKLFWSG